jgi:ligand-binding sensor domain-containing protein
LAALAGALLALDPNHHITQYGHMAWTVQDGKLPGGVWALTQSRDGWLWVGTEFGLFRFDGVRFTPVELPGGEAGRGQTITSLAAAPDGSVWIGTRNGLLQWNGSVVQRYGTKQGGRDVPVVAIHVDRGGGVWVGTVGFGLGGLARMERSGLRFFGPSDGFGGGGVQSIAEDNVGNVWFGCVNGLYRWEGSAFREIGTFGRVDAAAMNPQDGILAGTYVNALQRVANGVLHDFPVGDKSLQIPTRALLIDRDGSLWAGTSGQGLIHLHRGGVDRLTHPDGLSGSTVLRLFEDTEGNVWVATERGLDCFRELPVTVLSKREGLSQDMAGSVYPSRSGGMWVGTSAGLNLVEQGQIAVFTRNSGLPSEIIGSILEDRLGRLWVAAGTGMAIGAAGSFHRLAANHK